MQSKVYTRTGDKGTTSLFSGQRIPKDNLFIKALGTVDEANCAIGLALSYLPNTSQLEPIKKQLEHIQHTLFDIGAAIATPRTCFQEKKLDKTRFDSEGITTLEQWIDELDAQLPPLTTFILPGGHSTGAALHLSRSMIRRAERLVIPLFQQSDVDESVLIYLNRLSDYLFMVSRFVNYALHIPETAWTPQKAL